MPSLIPYGQKADVTTVEMFVVTGCVMHAPDPCGQDVLPDIVEILPYDVDHVPH